MPTEVEFISVESAAAEALEVTEVAHDPFSLLGGGVAQPGLGDWKESVRAATTANIALSGLLTIDGVTLVNGNRVLVKNQTTGSQNGLYTAAAGSWTRATDANSNAEVTAGLAVHVEEGTANGNKDFRLTTNNPITLGTTALTFAELSGGGGGGAVSSVNTRTGDVVGLAEQADLATEIANRTSGDSALQTQIDALAGISTWKAPVRAATTADITRSGTQTIDGVALIVGDRVLVKDESTPADNGIYTVAAGSWPRATDANSNVEVVSGMAVRVTEGTANGDKDFRLDTNNPITLGTTALTFTALSGGGGGAVTSVNTRTGAVTGLAEQTDLDAIDLRVDALEGATGAKLAPAVYAGVIPIAMDNQYQHTANGTIAGESMFTYQYSGSWYQVLVFPVWDTGTPESRPYITKRQLPEGKWETPVNLRTALGNAAMGDTHQVLAVGVDKNGYIHVMGNTHNDPMRYCRSNNPNDISTWTNLTPSNNATALVPANWTFGLGTYENSTTYQKLVRQVGGTDELFVVFRDTNNSLPGGGTTSNSRIFIYKYNAGTQTWSNPLGNGVPLLDGTVGSRAPVGPYLGRVAADRIGRFHIFYAWKYDTGVSETAYEDLEYICYDSVNNTIKKADGTTLTAPIEENEGDQILNTASDTDVGLAYRYGEVDSNNRPHILYHFPNTPGPGTNRHAYWNGTTWITNNFNDAMWTISYDEDISLVAIGTRMYAITGAIGGIRAIDVTPGDAMYGKRNFLIADMELAKWKSGWDTQALLLRNELHLVQNEVMASTNVHFNDVLNWSKRLCAVYTYDLDQWAKVVEREARIPSFITLASMNVPPAETQILEIGTAGTDLGWPVLRVQQELQGDFGQLMVRFVAQAQVTTTGTVMYIDLYEGTTRRARLKFDGAVAGANVETFRYCTWVPLQTIVGAGVRGNLSVRAHLVTGATGIGKIPAGKVQVELGILDPVLTGRGF